MFVIVAVKQINRYGAVCSRCAAMPHPRQQNDFLKKRLPFVELL